MMQPCEIRRYDHGTVMIQLCEIRCDDHGTVMMKLCEIMSDIWAKELGHTS